MSSLNKHLSIVDGCIIVASILLTSVVFSAGCARVGNVDNFKRSDRVCDQRDNNKAAEFVIDCAKAANPLSDEEGEDLVEQCERTALKFTCIKQGMEYTYDPPRWGSIRVRRSCRDAIGIEREACILHGYNYN